MFFGVPTLFAAMLAAPDRPPREATRLRACVSAGEALPKALGERFRDAYGVDILDGIGSTEMLHIFLSNRAGDVRYGTTGKPVAGYDIEHQHGPLAVGRYVGSQVAIDQLQPRRCLSHEERVGDPDLGQDATHCVLLRLRVRSPVRRVRQDVTGFDAA